MRTIKVFGVDVSAKFLSFKLDGVEYFIGFRDSKIKGVHDVFVMIDNKETNAEITNVYPPLKEVLKELRCVHFRYWLKKIIRKFQQLHSR